MDLTRAGNFEKARTRTKCHLENRTDSDRDQISVPVQAKLSTPEIFLKLDDFEDENGFFEEIKIDGPTDETERP